MSTPFFVVLINALLHYSIYNQHTTNSWEQTVVDVERLRDEAIALGVA